MRIEQSIRWACSLVIAATLAGCESRAESEADKARRYREIEERIKASMPQPLEAALAANADVPAEVVRRVQTQLAKLHHYQDEASGELDFVTVNAVMAFQRSLGTCGLLRQPCLTDDGVLDAATLAALEARAGS